MQDPSLCLRHGGLGSWDPVLARVPKALKPLDPL